MRKLLISLIAVSVTCAMTASLASSATKPVARTSAAPCSNTNPYLPPCTKKKTFAAPVVAAKSIVACQKTGTMLTFPIAVHAAAGLRGATVRFRGTTIARKSFRQSRTNARFRVRLSTVGLKQSLYTLTVAATDRRGQRSTKSAHFTICKPTPVFTG